MGAVKADIFTRNGNQGVLGLPTGTTAQRPNPASEGMARHNVNTGKVEVYFGGSWVNLDPSTGGADGSSAGNAFANLKDIAGLYESGVHNLYTTLGGNVTAFQMPISFDFGGPWYVLSFNFSNYALTEVNNTQASYGYNNSTDGALKNINNKYVPHHFSGNIREKAYIMAGSEQNRENQPGAGATNTSGSTSSYDTINYYNHATASNFSSTQLNVMRDIVTQLCWGTPHFTYSADSDNNGTSSGTQDWLNDDSSRIGYGHCNWIRDKNNIAQRTSNGFDVNDNNGFSAFWTHNTYQRYSIPWNWGFTSNAGNPTGLRTTEMIIPSSIKFYNGSGGGSAFGTYFSGMVGKINNRPVFLCR
jgi:hypothetical protein